MVVKVEILNFDPKMFVSVVERYEVQQLRVYIIETTRHITTGQFHENTEKSNIYFYFIFQLIFYFYHSIHTRCMEKHNLSIFTYQFGVKFII